MITTSAPHSRHSSDGLSLHELSELTGFSGRNIRYYITEGLLPPPSSPGRYARYGQEHLDRLYAIGVFKDMYLPLREIAHRLDLLTPEQMRDRPYLASLARMVDRKQTTSPVAQIAPPQAKLAPSSPAEIQSVPDEWQRFPLGDHAEFTISPKHARDMGPRLYELLHMIYAFLDDEKEP